MVTDEQIARINALAAKAKSKGGLSSDEASEQQNLRQIYLDSIRENLRAQLGGVKPELKKVKGNTNPPKETRE